jgi:hypothetical protein
MLLQLFIMAELEPPQLVFVQEMQLLFALSLAINISGLRWCTVQALVLEGVLSLNLLLRN